MALAELFVRQSLEVPLMEQVVDTSCKSSLRSWSWRPSFSFSPIIVWQGRQSRKFAFPRILDLLTNGQLVAGQAISEKCFQDIRLENAGSRSVLARTMDMYGFHQGIIAQYSPVFGQGSSASWILIWLSFNPRHTRIHIQLHNDMPE